MITWLRCHRLWSQTNYTILQLGLWLFIVREGREEQEQWSVPFSSTSLTSLRFAFPPITCKKRVVNFISTRTPAPHSPILVNDGPIWTWRTNSKEWRRSPRSAMSPTSPRCTRRRWGWCPLVPRKLWNSILKVTNCKVRPWPVTIPSRPKRCGCWRRVWLHCCYHWRRQECPAVLFQIHFRPVPSHLWLEGRRETQYDLYLIAIYWIYPIYQYIQTDVFQADRLEVTLKKPPLVNKDVKFMFTCSTKGVPVGYDNCAFFFWLNTFFIKYGWIPIYYWTAHNLVDSILLTTQIHK